MKVTYDGKELELKSLDINQLIEVEDRFGSLIKLQDTKEIPLKLVRFVAFLALRPHVQGLTEEQVGSKLDLDTIGCIVKLMSPEAKVGQDRPLP